MQACRVAASLIYGLISKKVGLALLVSCLFLAEAVLSMWTGLGYDMKVWFQTGIWMDQRINIYMPNDHLGYPPLWAFWCLISYRAYTMLGNNMELWRFIIKLPLILAQFALAFALYRFAEKRFDRRIARRIFLFALTWGFFIYIGAIWGQLNMLSALLTFLAFYAVISRRNTTGALLLGVATTLKIYPLIALPAFLAYILKSRSKKEAGKFALYACAVPVIFTLGTFAIYQWDILFLLRTLFYWTPVFEANPSQIQGGCMNLWSFTSILQVDVAQIWLLRFIWIPVLGIVSLYWLKRPKMGEADLSLALISFYVAFMVSYGWVTEQSFLDLLPFAFLQVLAYQAKKSRMYALIGVQALVFAFSAVDWGPFIFEPLLKQVAPSLLAAIQVLDPAKSSLIWTIRGVLGLAVSASLCAFLSALLNHRPLKGYQNKP